MIARERILESAEQWGYKWHKNFVLNIKDERGILYLYGGTISGGNCGVNVKGQLYLYGGTITGNGCGVSDAKAITIGGNVKITNNYMYECRVV